MDESFLFNASVIRASRNFVCIRAATYEDEAEAEFLKTIFVGRQGELNNTVFTMLSPDTKEFLCTPGRSPNFAFRSPQQMATAMDKLAIEFPATERGAESKTRLPKLKNFRLGLNVSSCDGLPLLVCVGEDDQAIETLSDKLVPLAFHESLAGRITFASTTEIADLIAVQGYGKQQGYVLIQPGEYGMEGKFVTAFPSESAAAQIQEQLVEFVNENERVQKSHNRHVRTGNQTGKNWETEIPVTDQDSLRAMERNKKR